MTTELIIPITTEIKELFTETGTTAVLSALDKKIEEFGDPAAETKKDRAGIKTFKMKLTKTRTFLEKTGKEFVAEKKAAIKIFDSGRKTLRDGILEREEAILKPVTEWEEAEEERVEAERQLELFNIDHEEALGMQDLFNREKILAEKEAELARQEKEKKQKEEAERLKSEQAERDEKLKKEAAEKVKKEAEEKIQDGKIKRITDLGLIYDGQQWKNDIAHIAVIDLQTLSDDDFDATINEIKKATGKRDKDNVELDRIAAEKKAKADQDAAVQKAKIDAEKKVAAEKKAEEQRVVKEKAIAERNSANRNHQKRINRESLEDLMVFGLTVKFGWSEDVAKELITAIARTQIRHITINY